MKGFSKIRDSMIFLNNFYLRKGRASARKSGGGNLTFSGCQCRSGRYEIAIKKEGVCVKTQCSYKIFASADDLKSYLRKNKNKTVRTLPQRRPPEIRGAYYSRECDLSFLTYLKRVCQNILRLNTPSRLLFLLDLNQGPSD